MSSIRFCPLQIGRSIIYFAAVLLVVIPFESYGERCYNISVSDTPQFVWFRVAKVGTRTIYQALRDNNVRFTINGYQQTFDPKKYKDYFKFAFVRNPWDRVVSCYFDKVVSKCHKRFKECFGKDFEYFVHYLTRQDLANADAHIRLQTKLIPMNHVNFIGRQETMVEDLQHVLQTLGLQNLHVGHKHKSAHEHYSHYYNERTKAIIARLYKADIDAFGYQFENAPQD